MRTKPNPAGPDSPTICTIAAKNYLAQTRCLTESFLAQHPDGRVFVLLVDTPEPGLDLSQERFTTVNVRQLNIPEFGKMAFRYDVLELCTAVKPFFLEYLFNEFRPAELLFFDPDIYFYSPLTSASAALADANILLVPHILHPAPPEAIDSELTVLMCGVYNLGFIGLRMNQQVAAFLRWWQERLREHCLQDVQNGLFVDQRWVDLAPIYFEGVRVLDDPGYNLGHWNLHERRLERRGTSWRVNGQPLVSFHYSGYEPDQVRFLSRHRERMLLEPSSPLLTLVEEYQRAVYAHGYESTARLDYAFGRFDNGVSIPPAARRLWRQINGEQYWPRPFETAGPDTFFRWLTGETAHEGEGASGITPLALECYRSSPAAQELFPDLYGVHRLAYLNWFVNIGAREASIPDEFLKPIFERVPGLRREQPTIATAVRFPSRAGNTNPDDLGFRGTVSHLMQGKSLPTLAEAETSGKRRWQRSLYYRIRNPLRRLGLHGPMRRLIGHTRVNNMFYRLVRPRIPVPPRPPASPGLPATKLPPTEKLDLHVRNAPQSDQS